MKLVEARNVNDALPKMIQLLESTGYLRDSRNGQVLVCPTPVVTAYKQPKERVLFSPLRDANPFFHMYEGLWMLAGDRDISSIAHYNKKMLDFSDDGVIQHGAYGFRWRYFFGFDQLEAAIAILKKSPDSRRAVIQMYSPQADIDIDAEMKDIPCNLTITPWLRKSTIGYVLDMTVFCRSNDIVWGAAGANIVHFSMLQEYLATHLNAYVGKFYQFSNNFHAYTEILQGKGLLGLEEKPETYYDRLVNPYSLVEDERTFDSELCRFMLKHSNMLMDYRNSSPNTASPMDPDKDNWNNSFFPDVAIPMCNAFMIWRSMKPGERRYREASAQIIQNPKWHTVDWLKAADLWLYRRDHKETL